MIINDIFNYSTRLVQNKCLDLYVKKLRKLPTYGYEYLYLTYKSLQCLKILFCVIIHIYRYNNEKIIKIKL